MYLLDNNKVNISNGLLNKITNITSIDDAIRISSKDPNLCIDNYFRKIDSYFKFSSNIIDSENNKNNLRNLFLSDPINLSPDDEEFKRIDKIIKNEGNVYFNMIFNSNIVETYKKLLINRIKENEHKTSYEIVGEVTKSFSKLFYGKHVLEKSDMDLFLLGLENLNNYKVEKKLEVEDIDTLKELSKKYQVKFDDNNINSVIEDISTKLYFKYHYQIRDYKIDNDIKIKQEYSELKSSLFSNLIDLKLNGNNNLIDELSEELSNTNDFLTLGDKTSEEIVEMLRKKMEKGFKDLNPFSKIFKNKNTNDNIEKIINEYEKLKIEKNNKINSLKENLKDKFNSNEFKEMYNDFLIFQKINNKFLESNTLEYSKYMFNKYSKIYCQNYFFDMNMEKEVDYRSYLRSILSTFKNKDDYKINDIKQFLYISLTNNKTIYDLFKNTDLLDNLSNNQFIKDVLNRKIDIDQKSFNIKRLEYISNILINDKNIEKIFQTDINVDIKKIFYKKLNLSLDSVEGEKKLNQVFKIFNEKSKNLNIKENNILILMILHSYKDNEFNERDFHKLFQIFKKPLNKIDQRDKELINSIDDKWFKWCLLVGREVKDKDIILSSINPTEFEFNKLNKIKKLLSNINSIENMNKNDNNLIHIMSKYNLSEEIQIKIYKEFNNINNIINDNNKKIEKDKEKNTGEINLFLASFLNDKTSLKNLFYLFNRTLANVLENNNEYVNNILKKLFTNENLNFLTLKDEIINLSKFINIVNDSSFSQIENITNDKLYNIIKGNNSIADSLIKIKDKELLNYLLENINSIPKMNSKIFNRYLDYYEEMKQKETFKNYKEEDSLIPIISKDMGNGYSYKVKTIKDFDILLTGEKTDCCMTIKKDNNLGHGAGFNIYEHMYNYPKENVIFEIYKNGKAIANSWTWIDNNQLTFDNIEVLGRDLRNKIIDCYRDASLEFILKNPNIEKITFGVSNTDLNVDLLGNDIKASDFSIFKYPNVYTDSGRQKCIISRNPFVININEMLSKLESSNLDTEKLFELKNKIDNVIQEDFIKLNNNNNSIKEKLNELNELVI